MTTPSFRVYFVTHHDGHLTGHLMRAISGLFDGPPQSAYGASEEQVLSRLELQLLGAEMEGLDSRNKYYWTERFEMGSSTVVVHPETAVGPRRVIGRRSIPLKLSYAWARGERGGYRVVLPRFDWWFVLEDLDIAPTVLQNSVAGALVGEKARWLYDFRKEGPEYVKEWTPQWAPVAHSQEADDPFEGFETVGQVADELLHKAMRRQLPVAVGHHDEFLPLRALLLAPRPLPLLVVGGPGVGKTVWIQRLARYLLFEKRQGAEVPRVFSTSADRVVAGQIYLGMWQARCLTMVEELSHERQYLSIGRLSEWVRPMPDGSSLADIFEEALRAEQLSLIAEATEQELEALRRSRPALIEAFHTVRLEEPSADEVPQLLVRYLEKVSAADRVHADGLRRLVRHLSDYLPSQCFPGKAYRSLTWLLQESESHSAALGPTEVSRFFSKFSGLPLELIADEFALSAQAIADRLTANVIGQDEACQAAGAVIARMKAGLQDPDRPVGSLFFVGPTGVGKTELAKQMARFLFGAGPGQGEDRLVRLDMSEYMLPGSAQRLLESEAAGAGSLAQRIREQPLSVVLLDEIEKAHPEVFDLLLALLGEGRMTDSRGRLVDFRMVVFVMTSNLGVSERAPVGFAQQEYAGYVAKVREHFRPEFFARLDRVVSFRALSPEDVAGVVDLMVAQLARRSGFRLRNLRLRVSDRARQHLASLGYHPSRGARPLKRVIEERVVTPIAIMMAEDPKLKGVDIWVVHDEASPPGDYSVSL